PLYRIASDLLRLDGAHVAEAETVGGRGAQRLHGESARVSLEQEIPRDDLSGIDARFHELSARAEPVASDPVETALVQAERDHRVARARDEPAQRALLRVRNGAGKRAQAVVALEREPLNQPAVGGPEHDVRRIELVDALDEDPQAVGTGWATADGSNPVREHLVVRLLRDPGEHRDLPRVLEQTRVRAHRVALGVVRLGPTLAEAVISIADVTGVIDDEYSHVISNVPRRFRFRNAGYRVRASSRVSDISQGL